MKVRPDWSSVAVGVAIGVGLVFAAPYIYWHWNEFVCRVMNPVPGTVICGG